MTMTLDSPDRLLKLINYHIKKTEKNSEHRSWTIFDSPLSGRGIFAIRDIHPGDVIFREKPLLVGPTARQELNLNLCSLCCVTLDEENFVCKRGCTLPVCPKCENSERHLRECNLYTHWHAKDPDNVSRASLRILAIVRGLLLDDTEKDLIYALQANTDPTYRNEIRNAAKCFRNFPMDGKTVEYLHRIVAVFNTNAFEAVAHVDGNEIPLRGLYPLSGIMNHQCTPNTGHTYDEGKILVLHAAKFIPKGAEIFTTYTKILWNNFSRRLFLSMTKRFLCECPRCQDPMENGALISAMFCKLNGCIGWIIPVNCVENNPDWRCLKCPAIYDGDYISKIQEFSLRVVTSKTSVENSLKNIIDFINEKIPKICPPSSQYTIEIKLHVIWKFHKSTENYSREDIQTVVQYCKDILKILDKLDAGECTLKFLLTDEIEKIERKFGDLSD